ncbi:zinc finger CCCH domain-containing protein 13-like isoform X2 [Acanthaster planci]|uniref:Zinc finger CCCH domain-containing protein 13-like isoform X2 n=1 Tax=Acanthaster planci TaxID=133434 RepID=A0A8B7YP68_ACAPL|nr:zinc finger CCCH domain-containing protein 13-like isoform X2 [Acanthaster planci]
MRRKVKVDSTKAVPDSTESRRPSVFERLGPGSSRESARDGSRGEQGTWTQDGNSSFASTSRFLQGQRTKAYDDRSPDAEPVDLRHRVESKRAERERERDRDRSPSSSLSPPLKDKMKYKAHRAKDTSSDRKPKGHDLSGSKVMKQEATPSPEISDADDWGGIDGIPAADDDMWDDDEASLDYRQALTLEMKRQQIQRELQQMEEEENQAREQAEHILQKEVSDDNGGGSYRTSHSPSPVRKKHTKKKKGRNKADKRHSPTPVEQSPPKAYVGKKRKRGKSEETMKQDYNESAEYLPKKKGAGSSHSPRGGKPAAAAAYHTRTPSPQANQPDEVATPQKYKGKTEMRKKSRDRDMAKRRSFSGNRSSDEEALSVRRKPGHSPTPPAQYRKTSKRPRSPSQLRSNSPMKRKPKHYETPPQRTTKRPPSPPSPVLSGSLPSRERSTSSSAHSESPRRVTGKRPRYQSPSPTRQTVQPSPQPRDRRGLPKSPSVRSPPSGRTGVKKQLQRSLSPSGSHRSYSPTSKRRSPSPRAVRRKSPSPTRKQPASLLRSSSNSRDNRTKKFSDRQGSDYQSQTGHPSDKYLPRGESRNNPPPADFQLHPRQRSDPRTDPRADTRGQPKTDSRGYQRGDARDDPRCGPRGDPRGVLRGDRGDTRKDSRGDLRSDLRADLRGDPRSDLRIDPRSDLRGDPGGNRRADLRGDVRGDTRGNSRADLRGDHRGDPKDTREDPRGDIRAALRGDSRGGVRADLRVDPRADSIADPRDLRRDIRPEPRGDSRFRVDPRADPRLDFRPESRRDLRDDRRADLRLDPRVDPRAEHRLDPRADIRSNQRVESRMDSRDSRGREQQERESRRDEWERNRIGGRKEMENIAGRDQRLARNRTQSSQDRQRDVTQRSESLDNRKMPKGSPSPMSRGRGTNIGRGPERELVVERRGRRPERGRGQTKGREPPLQKSDRGSDPGRVAQRGRETDRSRDKGKAIENEKGLDRDRLQEKGREPPRVRDGDPQRGSERGRDTRRGGRRAGPDRGRAQAKEGLARQVGRSFEESRRSRDSSTDSRKMDKQRGMEQQKGTHSGGRADGLKREGSRDGREDLRSRRGDSKGSSSSQKEKPIDQDRRQRLERSSERTGGGRDLPKHGQSPGRGGTSDSPAKVSSRDDLCHSQEKSYHDRDQDVRTAAPPEAKAIEATSKASTQDSKESTPLKEGSLGRPTEEVFSDWSEGGSDDLLNQSPPIEEQKSLPGLEDFKQDLSLEQSRRDRQRSEKQEKRSDDREKQEGTEGRSLRSLSYGSSSSRYSSVSSDFPGQGGSGGSLDQGTSLPKTAVDQEDLNSTSSPKIPCLPMEEKVSRDRDSQDKNSSIPPSREASVKQEHSASSDMYEVISDDEFDDILEDGNRDVSKQEEDAKPQEDTQADLTAVDWSSLMSQSSAIQTQSQTSEVSGSVLDKFRPGQVLARVGVSRALAGPELMREVEQLCLQAAEEEGSSIQTPLFENQLGAFNASAQRKLRQRKQLLTDIGPCRRALCARRDVMIRKQLGKVDKPEPDQVFSTSLLDAELFKINVQLFRAGKKGSQAPDLSVSRVSAPHSERSSPIAVCT